jgi:hypothetical protein
VPFPNVWPSALSTAAVMADAIAIKSSPFEIDAAEEGSNASTL